MDVPQIELKRVELRKQGIDVGEPRRTPAHPLGEPPVDAGFGGAVQAFSHGSIYWHPNTGAHFLRGPVLQRYVDLHGPGVDGLSYLRPLGFPIADITNDAERNLAYADFEWGSIYSFSEGGGFAIHQGLAARWPKLAKPNFVGPTGDRLTLDDLSWSRTAPSPSARRLATIRELWRGRLGLQSVAKPAEITNLEVGISQVRLPSPGGKLAFVYRQEAGVPTGTALRERTLYNVIMRNTRGEVLSVAPHAYYCRTNWDRFGILHVTDTHVSTRLDAYQERLTAYHDLATQNIFNNFNDNFRNLIRYANKLYRKGQLDLILLTGDLADYQFEPNDYRGGGGNFELFERLLLGHAPSPTGVPTEELLAPLCATLGNHDYRTDRYALNFKVGIPGLRHEVSSFYPMNLTEEEALFLQGEASTPVLSRDSAAEMVHFDTPTYALRRLCGDEQAAEATFVLRLGRHRVVLLDSKHDLGVADDLLGVLGAKLNGSEDERSFLGGSPNLVGVSDQHLELVRHALREAGDEGVVIVGIHAPCINPAGNDFAHFLREPEHPTAAEADIRDYLLRHRGRGQGPPAGTDTFAAASGQPFFSRGSNDFLDRDGVSKGELDDFLKLVSGAPSRGSVRIRPVDLVLSGHGHFRTEFRIAWDDEVSGWRFFTDFYTGNPGRYYCTRMTSVDGGKERIHIWVLKGAALNGPALRRTDDFPAYLALDVPSSSQSLGDAADKRQWWRDHRPVFLQTAALGPIETVGNTRRPSNVSVRPDPNFYGFRFITVAGSSINSIDYARFPEVRQGALTMPWEPSTVVTYDKAKGVGEIYVAGANGRLRLLRHYDNWPKSWAQIIRGDFGGRGLIDLLFYDPQAHTGEFWEVSADGSMRLLSQHKEWRSSWVKIVPGHFRTGGTTGLVFFEKKGGDHEVYGTGEGGAMTRLSHGKSGGESHVVPLNCIDGLFTDLLRYDDRRGLGILSSAGPEGRGIGSFTDWRPNWTHIVPGRFGGHGFSDLLFYQGSTGTGEFWALKGRGEISLIRSYTGWRTSWSHIVAGNFGGGQQSDLLFYEASTGTAEIWSCDSSGGMRLLNTISKWGGPWTHIVV